MTIRRSTLTLAVVAGFGLAACQNSGFEDNKNALGGAGFGAVTGAILGGAVAKDKSRGRKLGALVGGVAGAAFGARLDEQERALRASSIGQSGAVIQNTGSELIVTLPESITFAVDSARIKNRFLPPLQDLAANLQQYPGSKVNIVGHTDDTGTPQHNQDLSERRAQAVAGVLIASGVKPRRVRTSGAGEFSPIASNASAAGRAQNRRVVITITPQQTG